MGHRAYWLLGILVEISARLLTVNATIEKQPAKRHQQSPPQ